MTEPTLPEKVLAVHRALDRSGIAHAFGGALALAYYAEPRSTVDIDVNVFVATAAHPSVDSALTQLGVASLDVSELDRAGQVRTWWGRTPLDVFFAYDAVHEAMRDAVRQVPFGEATIPVLSPEHLVVCKAVFDRPKDWLDIEQVLVTVDDLDLAEIRRWLGRLVGATDPRRIRFDRLASDVSDAS
jgi:hypothetical protein